MDAPLFAGSGFVACDDRQMLKRLFDLTLAMAAALILLLPALAVALAVKATSRGPVLYWSNRVGLGNKLFKMPKFRTMQVDAPIVATHLLNNPATFLTPIGGTLRRLSLDEIPQLISIVVGHMSFVGPRPALFNQDDLIALRTDRGVHHLRPGLTGLAQINGRDALSIAEKVVLDEEYARTRSMGLDLLILAKTAARVASSHGVSH